MRGVEKKKKIKKIPTKTKQQQQCVSDQHQMKTAKAEGQN